MAVKERPKTGIKMTKKNRLAILTRAREIISDRKRWTKGRLRRKVRGEYRYCLLGACEQAVYDLGLAEPGKDAFSEPNVGIGYNITFGYEIGDEVSIRDYSLRTKGISPDWVNDLFGHEGALDLLDGYIDELKRPAKKEA